MPLRRKYFYPSALKSGVFDEPQQKLLGEMLDLAAREMDNQYLTLTSARNLGISLPRTLTGLQDDIELSLQEFLAPLETNGEAQIMPALGLIGYTGTLIEARALQGWEVCDGQGGTPDLRHRFLRGAGAGDSAGCIGGSDAHTHGGHFHGILQNDEFTAVLACAAGVIVASEDHRHNGQTCDETVASAPNVPSYYECIWLRRRVA